MNPPTSCLSVQALDVWRGEACLSRGIDFELRSGEAALVLGPNGVGKTTLLRLLAGLSRPRAGSIRWNGQAMHSLPFETRAEVAYRGHLEGLKKDLSIQENLSFYSHLWGYTGAGEELLEALGLAGIRQRRCRDLSAGQRRRLGLATLRAQQAQLWLLDEPMTNLDAAGRALVSQWLAAHLAGGGVAILATHQPDALASLATLAIDL